MSEALVDRVYGGDFREVLRNPIAFFGGMGGTVLVGILFGVLLLLVKNDCEKRFRQTWANQGREVWSAEFKKEADRACAEATDVEVCREILRKQWAKEDRVAYSLEYGLAVSEACPNDDDADVEIEFEPGALVRLGEVIEEKEIPEKIITADRREEEEAAEETVTEEEKPREEPPPEPEKEPKKDKPPPKEQKDKKLPTAEKASKKNTPYDELPTVDVNRGNPFGDPGGWSEIAREGDPWATSVMKALNNMPVGTYAAKAGSGYFEFQIEVCKDGRIRRVNKKGGNLPSEVQNAVRLALEQLRVPPPPADKAKLMGGSCAKIQYNFKWSAAGVR